MWLRLTDWIGDWVDAKLVSFSISILLTLFCGSSCFSQQDDAAIETKQTGLHGTVKVVLDETTSTLTLIGSKEDVALVKTIIRSFYSRLANSRVRVSVRIRLENQLAETAVEILKNSIPPELQSLKISAVSFPESLIIIGTSKQIEQVGKIIESIDSLEQLPPKSLSPESPSSETRNQDSVSKQRPQSQKLTR